MKNIFDRNVTEEILQRLEKLSPAIKPLWGKMNAAQMLAHCNVTYELVYNNKHPKPGLFKKFLLKMLVKNVVVNETPYKKNSPTATEFRVPGAFDFDQEKKRLAEFITRTQSLGENFFEGRESHSFGKLSARQWNNMFYKHLEHHFTQFGI